MSSTYQTYLLSIKTEATEDLDFNFNFDSEYDGWDQYFDIETQTIINSKNKYLILKPCLQFRQLPANKFFKKKNQNQKSNLNVDILESIKEEEQELFEDIETGKIYKNETNPKLNPKVYLYLINLQNIIVTSVFYISHIALIIFLVRF
jgi:hypothetical protein